jgi:hypothetical protein
MPATLKSDSLRLALIDAYRREIKKRYRLQAMRCQPVLDGVSDEKLTALREFFLDFIYPPSSRRDILDSASERVSAIFRSPRRMFPLMGLAAGTVWRLGTMLPSAVRMTSTTLESLRETRMIEQKMLSYAIEHTLREADFKDNVTVAQIISSIPEKEMDRFRNDVLSLFRSMNSSALLRAGVEIMTNAIGLMEKRPELYDDEDREGFKLGRGLIEGSLRLYEKFAPGETHIIVNGIERIEIEWYERMKRLARAQ